MRILASSPGLKRVFFWAGKDNLLGLGMRLEHVFRTDLITLHYRASFNSIYHNSTYYTIIYAESILQVLLLQYQLLEHQCQSSKDQGCENTNNGVKSSSPSSSWSTLLWNDTTSRGKSTKPQQITVSTAAKLQQCWLIITVFNMAVVYVELTPCRALLQSSEHWLSPPIDPKAHVVTAWVKELENWREKQMSPFQFLAHPAKSVKHCG